MSVIPCEQNRKLRELIESYSEALKTHAYKLGEHGLSEEEFNNSGIFRGAVERIRGQFSASMREKRQFVSAVLDHMRGAGAIRGWRSAGDANRHDYAIELNSGRTAVIELKGCLDGNNTNIFERPPHAQEFVLWSVCTNPGADPQHNAWSGIHTRLSAEIIARQQQVDGLLIWDMVCGTVGRSCPKLAYAGKSPTVIGPYRLPPPCIYVFPATIPSPRNNPEPHPQELRNVELLQAFHEVFGGSDGEVSFVSFAVAHRGAETVRTTRIVRNGMVERESNPTPIRRS